MTDDVRFELQLEEMLTGSAPVRAPARLRSDIRKATRPARQLPRWIALIKEPPMRISSRVAVGSPTLRLASIMAATVALFLVAAGAVALGASLTPNTLPTPFGVARNGSLVYHDGGDIWIADSDGSNGKAVVTGPENDYWPWYSHDGTKIAFGRDDANGKSQLIVANADGSGIIGLTHDYSYADWSPDDKQFAVSQSVDGESAISIVAADGSESRTLDLGGMRLVPVWGPVWRPTQGEELIFVAQWPGTANMALFGIHPDGTGLRLIGAVSTGPNPWVESFQNPVISPDGSTIAYTNWEKNDAGVTDAWGHVRNLTTRADHRFGYVFPHFSPDGSTVLSEAGAHGEIAIGPVDESRPPMLIDALAAAGVAPSQTRSWEFSPDGTKAYGTIGDPGATVIVDLSSGTSYRTSQSIPNFPYWQRLAP